MNISTYDDGVVDDSARFSDANVSVRSDTKLRMTPAATPTKISTKTFNVGLPPK